MTPYALLREAAPVREVSKRELRRITRDIERGALASPPPAMAATLQDVRHLTDRTREVYRELAATDLGWEPDLDDDRGFLVALSADPHLVASCGRLLGI